MYIEERIWILYNACIMSGFVGYEISQYQSSTTLSRDLRKGGFGGPSSYPTKSTTRDISALATLHLLIDMSNTKLKTAILVVSETASGDPSTDRCIPILKDVFANLGNNQWEVAAAEIIPDSVLDIQKCIRTWTDGEDPLNLIVTSGGTGFATKDNTPEV